MRVAHFCDSEPGRADGVSTSVGLAVTLLRQAGHQVSHYHPGPLWRAGRPGELRSVAVPFRLIRVAVPWARAEPADDVDVVHVHTTGPVGLAGFRLAATRRLPLVLTWHTDLLAYAEHFPEIAVGAAYCAARLRLGWTAREYLELAHRGRRHQRLLRLGRALMDRTSVLLAPSAKTAAGLAEFGDLPPVRTVPTPVALPGGSVGRDDLRAALNLPADAAVVLSVGRVTPEKNPVLLLRAFAELLAHRPDARLVLLGVRQGRRCVLAHLRELGVSRSVRLVPPVPHDQVGGYYRMADVLAFASTTDTQSLVVAEAESVGLPVVLADPALRHRPGALASRRVTCEATPGPLATALLRMLDDHELRERTRLAGLEADGGYPPERYLSLLTAAYDHARRRAGPLPTPVTPAIDGSGMRPMSRNTPEQRR